MDRKVFSNPRMEFIPEYAEQSAIVQKKFMQILAKLGADQALLYELEEGAHTLRRLEVEYILG